MADPRNRIASPQPWIWIRYLAVLGTLAFSITACAPTSPEDEFEVSIAAEIVKQCIDAVPCYITPGRVTSFQWDTLYVFPYTTSKKDIEAALNQPFPQYVELTKRFVFLLNGRIVHHENTQVNVEAPLRDEIDFAVAGVPFARLLPNSRFLVTRTSGASIPYYHLEEIK